MTVGVILLAHGNLRRATQVASHFCRHGVPVALHIDRDTSLPRSIRTHLAQLPGLTLLQRRSSPWGSWALVDAALRGCRTLLSQHPEVTHVALLSGTCAPIRSVGALNAFLAAHPGRDFIQSVQAEAASWVAGGLQAERFIYRFPVPYHRHRRLFDVCTDLQRRLPRSWSRRIPAGLTPCLGSQWWCLTRETIRAILDDPDLPSLTRYFRSVWIPDEAFFQTMVRKHSWNIEARSLTWAPFDRTGQPMTFYDDHLAALQQIEEGYFLVRKIWPGADAVYEHCLRGARTDRSGNGQALKRMATRARDRLMPRTPAIPRRGGRPGVRPYRVVYGGDALFPGLGPAIDASGQGPWLGPLFDPPKGREIRTAGGLSTSVAIARANPCAYLANLLRDQPDRPTILIRPGAPVEISATIADDPFAHVVAVAGAWSIRMQRDPDRSEAAFAATQHAETALLAPFLRPQCRARVDIWSLEDAVDSPDAVLSAMDLPAAALPMASLKALPEYLDHMRDAGMNPSMRVPPELAGGLDRHDLAAEKRHSAVTPRPPNTSARFQMR